MFCKSHLINIFPFDYQITGSVSQTFLSQGPNCTVQGQRWMGLWFSPGKIKPKRKLWWVGIIGCQVTTKPLHHSPRQQNKEEEKRMEKSFWIKRKFFKQSKSKGCVWSKGK